MIYTCDPETVDQLREYHVKGESKPKKPEKNLKKLKEFGRTFIFLTNSRYCLETALISFVLFQFLEHYVNEVPEDG